MAVVPLCPRGTAKRPSPVRQDVVTLTLPPTPAVSLPQNGQEHEVDAVLRRKFEGRFRDIEIVEREDLDLVRGSLRACDFSLHPSSASTPAMHAVLCSERATVPTCRS